MSRAHIIKAAGQDWVIGLVWRSFADYPSARERREDAQALGADSFTLRQTADLTQAGFCAALTSRKSGKIYSLASAIAEEYRQPWCGIFNLGNDIWWYIAVRDGQAILPDGDIAGDYETVLKARESHASYGDWQMHDGTLEDLRPVLEIAKKTHKRSALKSVETPPLWRTLAPLVLAVIVLVGGLWLYRDYRHSQQMAQQRHMRAFIRAHRRELSVLATTPAPDTWLAACAAVIKPLDISENGWLADRVTCANHDVTIIWERRAGALVSKRPPGNLSSDGNQVVQVQPLNDLPKGPDEPRNYLAADEALYDLLQPIGVQAVIGNLIRNADGINMKQSVHFTLPVSPFDVDFNKVPGLRLTTLNWVQSGWVLNGAIYAK